MRRITSVLVRIPDYETNLVIDTAKLDSSGFSLCFIGIWKGEAVIREYVPSGEVAYYTAIRDVVD